MQFQKMGIVAVRDKKRDRKRNQKTVLRGKKRQESMKTKIDISVAHTIGSQHLKRHHTENEMDHKWILEVS